MPDVRVLAYAHSSFDRALTRQRTQTLPFIPLPCPLLAVQGGEDGRSAGRGLGACCDWHVCCARCARLHACGHPSHAIRATLPQRWHPTGSSLPCHCTARVPITNAASSRAGVVQARCKASQRPPSCKLASALPSALCTPPYTPASLLRWHDRTIHNTRVQS